MKFYEIDLKQFIPLERDKVFEFFADAGNLQRITPPWLDFRIVTPRPIPMHLGALIDYRLKVRGIPLRWRSEITAWEPPFRFVDEQVRGPFRRWIHEHTFEEVIAGTIARDHVRYAVYGGGLINWLLVRHDVAKIFAFRKEKFREVFPMRITRATKGGG